MNTNQDNTLTNQDAFEKFYGKYQQPLVKDALLKNNDGEYLYYFTRDALAIWQAATKASEQRIQELERRCEALDIEFDQRDAIRLSAITELQAHVNQLHEAIRKIDFEYDRTQDPDMSLAVLAAMKLLDATPAQSLIEHDNGVIERIALALENADGEFKTLPEYVALVRKMKHE